MNSTNMSYDDLINIGVDAFRDKGMSWVIGQILCGIYDTDTYENIDVETGRGILLTIADKPMVVDSIQEAAKVVKDLSDMKNAVMNFFESQGIDDVEIDGKKLSDF